MPVFFDFLADACEMLRNNHPNVESYSLPKVFKLIKINDKQKTRSYVDAHLLDNYLTNVVNSGEKKDFEKAKKEYNRLIKDYQNGR